MPTATWRTPLVVLIAGCLISMTGFGIRSSFGLFLEPMTIAQSWSRETFGLAMALQNLLWGITLPFAGALADRHGTIKVIIAGGIKSYHSCETLPAPVFRRFRSRRRGVRMTVPLRTSAHGGTTGRPGDLRHPIRPCGDAQGVGNMGRIIRPECGLHEDGDGFSGFRMPGRGG